MTPTAITNTAPACPIASLMKPTCHMMPLTSVASGV